MPNKNPEQLYETIRDMSPDKADTLIDRHQRIMNELENALTVSSGDEALSVKSVKEQLDWSARGLIDAHGGGQSAPGLKLQRAGLLDIFSQELSQVEEFMGMDPDANEFAEEVDTIKGMTVVADTLGLIAVPFNLSGYSKAYQAMPAEYRIPIADMKKEFEGLVELVTSNDSVYSYMLGDSPDGKKLTFRMEAQILDSLFHFCNGNKDAAINSLSIISDKVTELTDMLDKASVEFVEIAAKLDLAPDAVLDYYIIYTELPEENRIPLEDILPNLQNITETYLSGIDDSLREQALLRLFGLMIQGESSSGSLSPEMYSYLITLEQDNVKVLSAKLGKVNSGLQNAVSSRQKSMEVVSQLVKDNPGWLQEKLFLHPWIDTSNDESIQAIMSQVKFYDQVVSTKTLERDSLIEKVKGSTGKAFVLTYELMLLQKKNTSDFLLTVHDSFESKDIPEKLKAPTKSAVMSKLSNPESSKFDVLLYSGDYSGAMEELVEMNSKRQYFIPFTNDPLTGEGKLFQIGHHDIVNTFNFGHDEDLTAKLSAGNSFASKKILGEGYMAYKIEDFASLPNGDNDLFDIDAAMRKITFPTINLLMRQDANGELSYIFVDPNGKLLRKTGMGSKIEQDLSTQRLHPDDIQSINDQDNKIKEGFAKVFSKNPHFSQIQSASGQISAVISPLLSAFGPMMEGERSDAVVQDMKDRATEARKVINGGAFKNLRENAQKAKDDLYMLKSMAIGYTDEFESQIFKMEEQLDAVLKIVNNPKVYRVINLIGSAEFGSNDEFVEWFVKDAWPWIVALGAAVAAIIITAKTLGFAGAPLLKIVGGLFVTAMVGTGAGMIGHEIGMLTSHHAGRAFFGEGNFENQTLLNKYMGEQQVWDEKTQQNVNVTGTDLVKTYGTQFVTQTLITFALLGAGKFVGGYLAKFAMRNATPGVAAPTFSKAAIGNLIMKIPRISPKQVNILKSKGMDSMLKSYGKELLQEIFEEGGESAAGAIGGPFGYAASLIFALDGHSVQYKCGSQQVVNEGYKKIGDMGVETTWSYKAGQSAELIQNLSTRFTSKNGFEVTLSEDGGTVIVKGKGTIDGTDVVNKLIFKPSFDSLGIRQLMQANPDASGNSEAESVYGMKKLADNKYEYDNSTPEGKGNLKKFLKKNGFLVIGDPESGSFKVRQGNDVVSFTQVSVQSEVMAEITEEAVGKTYGPAAEFAVAADPTLLSQLSSEERFDRAVTALDLEVNADGDVLVDTVADAVSVRLLMNAQGLHVSNLDGIGMQVRRGGVDVTIQVNAEVQQTIEKAKGVLTDAIQPLLDVTSGRVKIKNMKAFGLKMKARLLKAAKHPSVKILLIASASSMVLLSPDLAYAVTDGAREIGFFDGVGMAWDGFWGGAGHVAAGAGQAFAGIGKAGFFVGTTINSLVAIGIPASIAGVIQWSVGKVWAPTSIGLKGKIDGDGGAKAVLANAITGIDPSLATHLNKAAVQRKRIKQFLTTEKFRKIRSGKLDLSSVRSSFDVILTSSIIIQEQLSVRDATDFDSNVFDQALGELTEAVDKVTGKTDNGLRDVSGQPLYNSIDADEQLLKPKSADHRLNARNWRMAIGGFILALSMINGWMAVDGLDDDKKKKKSKPNTTKPKKTKPKTTKPKKTKPDTTKLKKKPDTTKLKKKPDTTKLKKKPKPVKPKPKGRKAKIV